MPGKPVRQMIKQIYNKNIIHNMAGKSIFPPDYFVNDETGILFLRMTSSLFS
jgi:hypothetical protein